VRSSRRDLPFTALFIIRGTKIKLLMGLGVIGKIAVIRRQTAGSRTIFNFDRVLIISRKAPSIRRRVYIAHATKTRFTGK